MPKFPGHGRGKKDYNSNDLTHVRSGGAAAVSQKKSVTVVTSALCSNTTSKTPSTSAT